MKRNLVLLIFCFCITFALGILKINKNINWEWIGIFIPLLIAIFVCVVDLGIRGLELYQLHKRKLKRTLPGGESIKYDSSVIIKLNKK